jgi:hypothetical protein
MADPAGIAIAGLDQGSFAAVFALGRSCMTTSLRTARDLTIKYRGSVDLARQ